MTQLDLIIQFCNDANDRNCMDKILYIKQAAERAKADNEDMRAALEKIIRIDDTGPMTFEIMKNGPSQAIGGSEGEFAAIARAALSSLSPSSPPTE